jgi:hypothetical protein
MQEINPRLLVQPVNISDDSLKLKTPFCLSITGPSQGIIIYDKIEENSNHRCTQGREGGGGMKQHPSRQIF